ncbi:MAG: HlyC/CorC family transporter [Deltaproteobacteria bacterium]|nr:HlyC/CorC family transporter [Deltaproteobacteria bacterium]
MEWLFSPLAAPLAFLGRSVGSLVPRGGGGDPERLAALAVEHVIEEGEEEGFIAEDQALLLRSVLEFRQTVAREVMVPRTQLAAFELRTPMAEIVRQVMESGHSRYPVYDGSIDQVVGVLYAKDLFQALQGQEDGDVVELRAVVRSPAFFCPETQKVGRLLREMQARRVHLAVVVDEFGGTSGVLTLEDILEEIVGEIRDEHDDDEEAPVQELAEGRWVADASTSVHDLTDHLAGFEGGPDGEYDSLGGLVVALAGCVPRAGERLERQGFAFLILDGDERHVKRVEITRLGAEADAEAVEAAQNST